MAHVALPGVRQMHASTCDDAAGPDACAAIVAAAAALPCCSYDVRCGGMEGESPLEDEFFNATQGEEALTAEQYEGLLRDWGYGRCADCGA